MTKILSVVMMILVTLVILMTWNCESVNCQTTEEYQLLKLVNQERKKVGLNPLFWNNTLYSAAKTYTNLMATKFFLSHVSPIDGSYPWDRMDKAGYEWMTVGENIAAGQPTPESVMQSWMNSAGHKANILNSAFTEFAAASAVGSSVRFWSQLFGSKFPECGNGFVDLAWGETCDDGNLVSGDGCSAQCTVETGYSCSTDPNMLIEASKCTPTNGKRNHKKLERWSANPMIKKFLDRLMEEMEEDEDEGFDLLEEMSSSSSSAKRSYLGPPLAAVGRRSPFGKLSEVNDNVHDYDEYNDDDEDALMRQLIALGKRFLTEDDRRRRRARF